MHKIYSIKPVISANDLFKAQYQKVLRWSVLAALILTALGVWIMPSYEPNPYVLRDKFFQLEDFQIAEDLEIQEKIQIKAPPVVREIEPVTGDDADEFELPDTFEIGYFPIVTAPGWEDPVDKFTPTSNKPVITFFAKPDYPEIARMSHLEGVVIVKVLVGKNGLVEKTVIIQGINPILDRAAANAARKCRFQPGTQRTIPVKAWIAIPYAFHLK